MEKRGLIKNFNALLIGNLLSRPIWMVFSIFATAKLMGVGEYGLYNQNLIISAFIINLLDCGVNLYYTKEIAKDRNQINKLYTPIYAYRLFISIITLLGLIIYTISENKSFIYFYALLSASVYNLGISHLEFFRSIARGVERMDIEAKSLVVEKFSVVAIGSLTLCASIYLFESPNKAAFTLTGMWIGVLISLWQLQSVISKVFLVSFSNLSYKPALKLLRPAFGLALPILLVNTYKATTPLLLSHFKGYEALGIYSFATRNTEILLLIPTLFSASFFPRLVNLYSTNTLAFRKLLLKGLATLIVISITISIVSWLSEPLIFRYFSEFNSSAPIFKYSILFFSIISINTFLFTVLIAMDCGRFLYITLGIALFLNFTTSLLVIPQYSYWGALYSWFATDSLICVMFIWKGLSHSK